MRRVPTGPKVRGRFGLLSMSVSSSRASSSGWAAGSEPGCGPRSGRGLQAAIGLTRQASTNQATKSARWRPSPARTHRLPRPLARSPTRSRVLALRSRACRGRTPVLSARIPPDIRGRGLQPLGSRARGPRRGHAKHSKQQQQLQRPKEIWLHFKGLQRSSTRAVSTERPGIAL